MILPDRMFFSAWILDPRFRGLKPQLQLLLTFLRPLCDRNGRFEFNPARIHMALYVSANCGNVSVRDVNAWLEILRSGGFIKTYTGAAGLRVGEVEKAYWRQKLTFGRDVFEAEGAQPELGLLAGDPPPKPGPRSRPKPRSEEKRVDVTGARGAPQEKHTHTDFSIAALQTRWPDVDLAAELAAAQTHVRAKKGAGATVDLLWFERHWLTGVGPKLVATGVAGVVLEPEPEAWRVLLKDNYPDESWASSAAACTWASMPAHWRQKILREMARDGRKVSAA